MRLFAGVELSESEREPLVKVQRQLAGTSGVRWTKPENLHITLRFFGKWAEERLSELTEMLGGLERPTESIVTPLTGLRFLPGPHYPQVFIAAAEASQALLDLQRRIEVGARDLGMRPETKPFIPHVTLGRLRNPKLGRTFVDKANQLELELGAVEIHGFSLISSDLSAGGPRYSALCNWRF